MALLPAEASDNVREWLVESLAWPDTGDKEVSGARLAEEVEARVAALERRLPAEATLDKVADVNHAIFGTKIEGLEESIRRLDQDRLSKWDVVTILFAVLAALSAITGAIFAIIALVE